MKNYQKYSDSQLLSFWDETGEICADKGDDESLVFSEIYDRLSTGVYNYCLRKLNNNRDTAKDILQETFISLYNNLKKGCRISSLYSYLIGISRNLCLNYFNRRQKNTVPLDSGIDYLNIENIFEDMSSKIESDELFGLVLKAVQVLPEEQREAYELREFSGLKYSEIAEICGLTLSCAKERVYRTQDKIRKILSPYIDDLKK